MSTSGGEYFFMPAYGGKRTHWAAARRNPDAQIVRSLPIGGLQSNKCCAVEFPERNRHNRPELSAFGRFSGVVVSLDEFDDGAREQLGQRLEHARRRLGLTLDDVGQRAGYDARTVRKAIRGERIRLATLHHICKALGVE